MNESETVQKAYTDEQEQDAEDVMIETLQENMLSLSFCAQVNISIIKFIKFFKSVVFVREPGPFRDV